jgi:hypothetical protein
VVTVPLHEHNVSGEGIVLLCSIGQLGHDRMPTIAFGPATPYGGNRSQNYRPDLPHFWGQTSENSEKGKSKSRSTHFRGFIFIYLKSKRCILVAVI